MKIRPYTNLILKYVKVLYVLFVLFLSGCTVFFSIGKGYEFDELIVRKYQSKTDLPPEVLAVLKAWIAEQPGIDNE